MRLRTVYALFITSFLLLANAEALEVVTYNTGLLKIGIDLVPCVKGRREALRGAIERRFNQLGHHFILALQEVWSPSDYDRLKQMADDHFWSISTASVASRGLVTITDGKIRGQGFASFSCDTFPIHNQRGVLMNEIYFEDERRTVQVINLHTSYSGFKGSDGCHLKQLKEIEKLAGETGRFLEPSILMGDFNAGADLNYINPNHPKQKIGYSPYEKIWEPLYDALTCENPNGWREIPLHAVQKSWDGRKNPLVSKSVVPWEETPSTLDHIFISSGFEEPIVPTAHLEFTEPEYIRDCDQKFNVSSREWFKTYLSDHFGVGARLR